MGYIIDSILKCRVFLICGCFYGSLNYFTLLFSFDNLNYLILVICNINFVFNALIFWFIFYHLIVFKYMFEILQDCFTLLFEMYANIY